MLIWPYIKGKTGDTTLFLPSYLLLSNSYFCYTIRDLERGESYAKY